MLKKRLSVILTALAMFAVTTCAVREVRAAITLSSGGDVLEVADETRFSGYFVYSYYYGQRNEDVDPSTDVFPNGRHWGNEGYWATLSDYMHNLWGIDSRIGFDINVPDTGDYLVQALVGGSSDGATWKVAVNAYNPWEAGYATAIATTLGAVGATLIDGGVHTLTGGRNYEIDIQQSAGAGYFYGVMLTPLSPVEVYLLDAIDSISLTPGPTGPTGAKGDTGATGLTGATGPTGPQGPAGADGAAGADGIDGTNGTNGTNGIDGKDGADGAIGPTGPTGPQGPAGLLDAAGMAKFNSHTHIKGSGSVNTSGPSVQLP